MAGTLKKKSLMRAAFLQSAHMNMVKRNNAPTMVGDIDIGAADDDDDSDDEHARGRAGGRGGEETDAHELVEQVQKVEKLKKQKLALVHEHAVQMLKQMASQLAASLDHQAAVAKASAAQAESDIKQAGEEAKAEEASGRRTPSARRSEAEAAAEAVEADGGVGEVAAGGGQMAHGLPGSKELGTEQKRGEQAALEAAQAREQLKKSSAGAGREAANAALVKEQAAVLEENAARIAEMQSQLEAKEIELTAAKDEVERQGKAAEGQAAAGQEAERLRGELEQSQKELEETHAELDEAWATLDEARGELERLEKEASESKAAVSELQTRLDSAQAEANAAGRLAEERKAEAEQARAQASRQRTKFVEGPPSVEGVAEPPAAAAEEAKATESAVPAAAAAAPEAAAAAPAPTPIAPPAASSPPSVAAGSSGSSSQSIASSVSCASPAPRAARLPVGRRSAARWRGSDQATEVLLSILRAELNTLEAGRHEAEAREAAGAGAAQAEHDRADAAGECVEGDARARAGLDGGGHRGGAQRGEGGVGGDARQGGSHTRSRWRAVTAARVEAAEQANRDILAAAVGGGQGATQPPPPSNSKANGGALDEKSLREQLDRLHQLHLEQSKAMAADYEAKLHAARLQGVSIDSMGLARRANAIADAAPSGSLSPLAALLAAVREIDPRLCEALGEGLRQAQRQQLLELTEAGAAPPQGAENALDKAVRTAWDHLWELSLAPPEGREAMLAEHVSEHGEARVRVAAHVSNTDEMIEAAAVAERYLAVQRAESTDGMGGYRRSVRELAGARDELTRERHLVGHLQAELESAYASVASAERLAAARLSELEQVHTCSLLLRSSSAGAADARRPPFPPQGRLPLRQSSPCAWRRRRRFCSARGQGRCSWRATSGGGGSRCATS